MQVHEHTIGAVQLTFELQQPSNTKDAPTVGVLGVNKLK